MAKSPSYVRNAGVKVSGGHWSDKSLSILFTCIGRRVSLLQSFRDAAKQLGIAASFYGTDITGLSAALQLCDKQFLVKATSDPGYINDLLKIVKDNHVDLIVPTIDSDLLVLARNKGRFGKFGCRVLVSEPEIIRICQDKRKTYAFLKRNGFDAPLTYSVKTVLSKRKLGWPVFIKPWDGCASRGNAIAENGKQLRVLVQKVPNAICQEFIRAPEYTCDVYVDFAMKVRCVVPRRRIEIRAGEVSKGQVCRNPMICEQAKRLVEKLRAGPGVLTLQLFLTEQNAVKFIEINPRFGGGVPLAIQAGADFPKWVLEEMLGKEPDFDLKRFKDNLVMLRYDAEIWVEGRNK